MQKEIFQLGNSLAVIIPRPLARIKGMKKGDSVDIESAGDGIQIKPVEKITPVNLRGLVPSRGFSPKDLKKFKHQFTRQFIKKWKNI